MICPFCKQEIPHGSRFCQFYGCSLNSSSFALKEIEGTEKKHKLWIVIPCLFTVMILAAVGIYWETYCSAKNSATERDYSKAKQIILFPSLTQLHDPNLILYVDAGQQLLQGHYSEAKTSFNALGNYLDSKELEKEAAYYEALDNPEMFA